MLCRHYIVEGRVQGVFFRASTRDRAREIGVTGWVRNLNDGRVEAIACGSDQQLATLEQWLSHGPPMASVNNLIIKDHSPEPDNSEFLIR